MFSDRCLVAFMSHARGFTRSVPALEHAVRPQEDELDDVLGVLPAAGEMEREPERVRGVRLVQRRESRSGAWMLFVQLSTPFRHGSRQIPAALSQYRRARAPLQVRRVPRTGDSRPSGVGTTPLPGLVSSEDTANNGGKADPGSGRAGRGGAGGRSGPGADGGVPDVPARRGRARDRLRRVVREQGAGAERGGCGRARRRVRDPRRGRDRPSRWRSRSTARTACPPTPSPRRRALIWPRTTPSPSTPPAPWEPGSPGSSASTR